ncbi:trafficking protein particle complex subunit 13 homolog isoform X2 [Schistocerca gregaria]|nr:trafficking protein particle complex subunit 13 homolog isoform X2 [Schistocerca gregaria]
MPESISPHIYSGILDSLQLPNSPEFLLGEELRFYVHFSNDSDLLLTNVSLKCSLANTNGNSLICLIDTTATPLHEFKQSSTQSQIMKFKAKDAVTYILALSIQYTLPSGQQRANQRYFKVPVKNSVSIHSELLEPLSRRELLVKTEITNLTSNHQFMVTEVNFLTTLSLTATNLTPGNVDDGFGQKNVYIYSIVPESSIQLLHCLTSKDPIFLKESDVLGYVSLHWYNTCGSEAHMDSNAIIYDKPESDAPFKIIAVNTPPTASILRVFDVTLTIKNVSQSIIRPRLIPVEPNMAQGIILMKSVGDYNQPIPPGESIFMKLELMPLEMGMQTLDKIRLIETEVDKTYDLGPLLTVLVE